MVYFGPINHSRGKLDFREGGYGRREDDPGGGVVKARSGAVRKMGRAARHWFWPYIVDRIV